MATTTSTTAEDAAAAALTAHHQLGHVALDLDLAGHERLHPGLLVAGDEHVLGGAVVGGEGDVGVVDEAHAHLGSVPKPDDQRALFSGP